MSDLEKLVQGNRELFESVSERGDNLGAIARVFVALSEGERPDSDDLERLQD